MGLARLKITQPQWLDEYVDWRKKYTNDDEMMGLAIDLARQNLEQGTGTPFGAVIFDCTNQRPVGVGVNLVQACNNSILHAETMAIMSAQAGLALCSLAVEEGGPAYVLAASSEPCAMCLGAAWYAGIRRIIHGTLGHEIRPFGFGLGPGLAQLRGFLESGGVEIKGGIRSAEVIELMERTQD